MDYKLTSYKDLLNTLDVNDIPSNIDMFYDLSYQLSTYIFDYRLKHKLSQKDFAEILGVKQSMISKLESGNYNISLENICNVMAKLNTKIELNLKSMEENILCTSQNLELSSEPVLISFDDAKKLSIAS